MTLLFIDIDLHYHEGKGTCIELLSGIMIKYCSGRKISNFVLTQCSLWRLSEIQVLTSPTNITQNCAKVYLEWIAPHSHLHQRRKTC